MMNKIIDFSDQNRFLIFLFVAVAIVLGWNAMRNTKLDAIPDLSDTQVIVYAKWDRSPDIMEDQVSYPIASALLGLPKVKDIRAFSDFGFSYIYIIFDEGTDIYWARSRTLEYLNSVTPRLPKGVSVELAKDVTSVGWVYQYALVDTTGKYSIDQLRSYQDWYLRYALQTVPGVAEVAPIGGFVRQYQVNVDPNKLLAYKIPINAVSDAIQKSNNDVGGRLVEFTRPRIHGSRPRIHPLAGRHRQDRYHGQCADWNSGARQRRGHRDLRPRHAQRRCGTGWQG